MKNIVLAFLSMTLLLNPAYAREKVDSMPLTAGIQEVQAATLDDNKDTGKPKGKNKATKKSKKSKKANHSPNHKTGE